MGFILADGYSRCKAEGSDRISLSMVHPNHILKSAHSSLTGLKVANGEPLIWGKRTYVMGIINLTPTSEDWIPA